MTEPYLSFDHAAFKIEWAKKHINDLKFAIDAFLDTRPYHIAIQSHPETGKKSLDVVLKGGGIPANIPLLIGDAVHALRCSFDYAWNGIERSFDPERIAKLNFPFGETEQSARATADPALKKWSREDIGKVVFDTIKPYAGGNQLIWAISRLDNRDKHNLLVPSLSALETGRLKIEAPNFEISIGRGKINLGNTAALFGFEGTGVGELHIESDGNIAVQIVIGKGHPFSGEPVIETLLNMTEATTEALKLLRDVF